MPTPTGNENLAGALALAQQICWDETHGYVMGADMNPDTDCSGLVGYALSHNGFNVNQRWDTTTMIPTLSNYPGFAHYIYSSNFTPQHGDIFVYDEGGGAYGHTFFYAENVRGYTDNTGNTTNTGTLARARIEAASSRGTPQTGDQAKDGTGAHWEVWVHPWSAPSLSHTWHVFRWGGAPSPGNVPPWLMAKIAAKKGTSRIIHY